MFKAPSDPASLWLRGNGAQTERDRVGTVSACLKVLLQARLAKRRREGKNAVYAIADDHVFKLVENAVAHAGEHR